MKKQYTMLFSLLLSVCVLFFMTNPVWAWDGTTKTEPATDQGGVYLIQTAAELAWFSDQVFWGKANINAKLTANIDLSDKEWTPIGDYSQRYRGTFDGNGFSVSGLMIAESENPASHVGLFGYVEGGTIQNLAVEGSVYGKDYVAGIAGSLNARRVGEAEYLPAAITNCSFRGSVTAVGLYVGAIAGYNLTSTVADSANYGDISTEGDYNVGGIVGNNFGTIESCYNEGVIQGNQYVGGITGHNFFGYTSNSYNAGTISGNNYVGGIVGCLEHINVNIKTEVKNCYSTGKINSAGAKTGGVAGSNSSCYVTNCYYLDSAATVGIGADNTNGSATAKTAAELQDGAFVALLNGDGSSFIADTEKQNGGNPILSWQKNIKPPVDPPDTVIFTDVSENDWFYDAVTYCAQQQMFQGVEPNVFAPNRSMTRGMFVTVLGRYEGVVDSSQPAPRSTVFSDVKPQAYYAAHVAWAQENQIVDGKGNGLFDPDASISREEMATILLRYSNYKGFELPVLYSEAAFADAESIGAWALPAVEAMQKAGILKGKGNNLFVPKDHATRAEVATILYRYFALANS